MKTSSTHNKPYRPSALPAAALVLLVSGAHARTQPVPGESGPDPAESTAAASEDLSAADWSDIRAAYEAGRYRVRPVGDGHRAWNPGQRWTTRFDGRGFTVTPEAGDWTWGLELRSYGLQGAARPIEGRARVVADSSRVTYTWSDRLEEWVVNGRAGLEHGYTLHAPPPGAEPEGERPLVLTLAMRGDLRARTAAGGRSVTFTDYAGEVLLTYRGLNVFDANGIDLPARLEPADGGLRLIVDPRGARYPITVDPLAQQAYLKASNTDAGDRFGNSVAVSGDTVVVGAPDEDSGSTGVNGNQADNGAHDSGAAYVFVRDPQTGTWTQQAYLKASNTGTRDEFGRSVAISGDTAVVVAPLIGSMGAAYVFVRDPQTGTWTQQAYLTASNSDFADRFGASVAVSGDTAVVGAVGEDSSSTGVNGNQADNGASSAGAAYVFVRDPQIGTWSQQAYLKASNTEAHDDFGNSVAVSGDTAVVGAWLEDSSSSGVNGNQADNAALGAGAAYVFVRDPQTGTWSQQAYLKASNTDANDHFGDSVAISGNTVVIGAEDEDSGSTGVDANQADNTAFGAGAAYVFVRDPQTGTWSQQAYLKASNTDDGDDFGSSVAVSGHTAVVGAWGEEGSSTGVDGNQADNAANDAGAAYVFVRDPRPGTWTQHAYLKASNADAQDQFGWSVAVSGDTAAVGAPEEDSISTGVDGNQADDGANNAGAAYIFTVPCGAISPYGAGCPGTGGFAPTLSGFPCATAGGALTVRIDQGLGSARALLLAGTAQFSQPVGSGCLLLVSPPLVPIVLPPLAGSGAGNGWFQLTATLPPATPPVVTLQAAVLDPANGLGFSMTNGLRLDVE